MIEIESIEQNGIIEIQSKLKKNSTDGWNLFEWNRLMGGREGGIYKNISKYRH